MQTKKIGNSSFFVGTNINNITNITNITDITDITIIPCENTTDTECFASPAGASGIASLSEEESSVSRRGVWVCPAESEIPANWRGVKFDLFKNKTHLKLKVSVIKNDGTTQYLVAHLNSPRHYVFRGVDLQDRSLPQWKRVKEISDELTAANIDFKISKCCLPNKGSRSDMVVALSQDQNQDWIVILILKGQDRWFSLPYDAKLTNAQIKANMISSRYIGQKIAIMVSCEDLGL